MAEPCFAWTAGIQSCLPKHALDQLQLVDAGSEDACSSQMLLLWQGDLGSRRHDEVMLRMNAGMTSREEASERGLRPSILRMAAPLYSSHGCAMTT